MNKYHNLYQILTQLDQLNSENILNDTDFDLTFFKTDYNTDLGRFVASLTETTIDNKETLGTLFITEYLHDFVEYWKNIELKLPSSSWDRTKWRKYLDIKINMVKLLRSYSIYKGTEIFIKFVYNLYAHLTTSDFINENEFIIGSYCEIFSNFKNLEYNLKGTLPDYEFNSIIKPCCHPAGWVCNYSGNNYEEEYDIICYDNHLKNNYCYIDYAGCNSIVNINNHVSSNTINHAIYDFDSLCIYQSDLITNRKVNFQFDEMTLINGGISLEIDEESIL